MAEQQQRQHLPVGWTEAAFLRKKEDDFHPLSYFHAKET